MGNYASYWKLTLADSQSLHRRIRERRDRKLLGRHPVYMNSEVRVKSRAVSNIVLFPYGSLELTHSQSMQVETTLWTTEIFFYPNASHNTNISPVLALPSKYAGIPTFSLSACCSMDSLFL